MSLAYDIQRLKKRAKTGDAFAAFRYGSACLRGSLETSTGKISRCHRSVREGGAWLKQAAEHGCGEAMIELGIYYGDDSQVRDKAKKLRQALYWEKKAWRTGVEVAGCNIAITYSKLGMRRRCHEWLVRSYKRCPWSACAVLAKTYLCGYGVRRDVAKAVRLFQEVLTDSESIGAHRKLARHYLKMIKKGAIPEDDSPYP